MQASASGINIKQLILVPALIALGVTIIRLVGELSGGPSFLFNRAAGGQGALVGIVWLVPIFGIYFAIKLMRAGHAPERAGKVIGLAILGPLVAAAIIAPVIMLTGDPDVSVSLPGVIAQQLTIAVASVVALLIVRRGWRAFFQTMLAYAFASRIPVLVVMLLAMMANWGTHYEKGPAGYPEMGFFSKFILGAAIPQMTFWIMFTVVFGTLLGGITAALLKSKKTAPETAQAKSASSAS